MIAADRNTPKVTERCITFLSRDYRNAAFDASAAGLLSETYREGDLVRLGLERGATAYDALQVIVDLMAEYGQGGNCAEHLAMNYHNAYLIADRNEAWVLETAGRYWVAKKITSGTCSISNSLSIHGRGDLRHPELDSVLAGGQAEESRDAAGQEFDFAQVFSGTEAGETLSPLSREGRVRELCRQNEGKFTVEIAKSILRDHAGNICMHGDFETRGSQVSVLGQGDQEHWFIERPFPCREKYHLHTRQGKVMAV